MKTATRPGRSDRSSRWTRGGSPGPVGFGSTSARDWGAFARLTPLERFTADGGHIRIDASFGYSILSANDDATVTFINEDVANPVTRHRRAGGALHIALDPALGRGSNRDAWSWYHHGLSPLISIGVASDWARLSAGGHEPWYETHGEGVEVTLANVVSARGGNYTDRAGDVVGQTYGYGVGFQIGRIAGFRYDAAWVPQASGLQRLKREGASVWLDPFELARTLATSRGTDL